LAGVHDVFHVSQLKKYLKAPTDVVVNDVAPLKADMSYLEHPVKLLDQQDWGHKEKDDSLLQGSMESSF
jgi:hypothetical protein